MTPNAPHSEDAAMRMISGPHCDSPFCHFCEGMEARWLREDDEARARKAVQRAEEQRWQETYERCGGCGNWNLREDLADTACWACGWPYDYQEGMRARARLT